MKNKSPESGSARGRIGDFEALKGQITPEVLRAMMNGYSDEQFWEDECLRDSVESDVAFGAKIWTSFNEILEHAGIKNSEQPDDRGLVEEFNFLSQLLMRADLPIDTGLRIVALRKIKQEFVKRGFPEEALKGTSLMKLAYIGEAETMEAIGINWKEQSPFTVGLRLNVEHPMVQEVLAEEEHKLSAEAIKSYPDLTKIFEEFYKGKKPPMQ